MILKSSSKVTRSTALSASNIERANLSITLSKTNNSHNSRVKCKGEINLRYSARNDQDNITTLIIVTHVCVLLIIYPLPANHTPYQMPDSVRLYTFYQLRKNNLTC